MDAVLDVVIQSGKLKNEFSALCQLIDRYIYGDCPIFVADRGFASFNVFAHALEKGCFFAIRAKDINIRRLLAAESLPSQMDRWADVILSSSKAKKKRLHPELESLYRCICKAVPFGFLTHSCPEYHMHLRVVRFQIAEGINELIRRYILPVKPGRTYARQLRFQIPTSFAYRFV